MEDPKKEFVKKLTIGDNSGTQRSGRKFTVRRRSLAEIDEGEKVLVRFKGEFLATDYRPYVLECKEYRDDYDYARGVFTGVFVRAR